MQENIVVSESFSLQHLYSWRCLNTILTCSTTLQCNKYNFITLSNKTVKYNKYTNNVHWEIFTPAGRCEKFRRQSSVCGPWRLHTSQAFSICHFFSSPPATPWRSEEHTFLPIFGKQEVRVAYFSTSRGNHREPTESKTVCQSVKISRTFPWYNWVFQVFSKNSTSLKP